MGVLFCQPLSVGERGCMVSLQLPQEWGKRSGKEQKKLGPLEWEHLFAFQVCYSEVVALPILSLGFLISEIKTKKKNASVLF